MPLCMTNLRNLSDESLISETKTLVQDERRVSLAILHHLREIDRRRLFAGLGYSSLYEYCTRVFGYAEASAQRRIQAARLLADCPELAPQIESGSLSLSVLSQAQTFFRREAIRDVREKREILKTLEHQSSRQAERKLLTLASEPAKHLPEKVRAISDTHSEVRFTAAAELIAQIEELKNLLGEASMKNVIAYAVKTALEKKRPKTPKAIPTDSPPAPEVTTRYIPVAVKRFIWARDLGQCRHVEPKSGRRCSSRFGLEFDHLKPYALGGGNTPENLALKCKAHNTWSAIGAFGQAQMARFKPTLRQIGLLNLSLHS